MFKAKQERLFERPGYERLESILSGDLSRGDLGRFRQEMRRIQANKLALMRASEEAEKKALRLAEDK